MATNLTPGSAFGDTSPASGAGFTTGITEGGVFTTPGSGSLGGAAGGTSGNSDIAAQLAAIILELAELEAELAQEILDRIAGDAALDIRVQANADGLANEIQARGLADDALQALIDANVIAITANATEIATKQDFLIAGTNITLVDNGNDTTTVNSTAGGGGGTGTAYSIRIDFTGAAPSVTVNTLPDATISIDTNADSISVSGNTFPSNTQVVVNGILFLEDADYTINTDSSIINFIDYDLENGDGDIITLTGTYT